MARRADGDDELVRTRIGGAVDVSDSEETPAAAEARRAAGATKVGGAASAGNDNDDDELDDFGLSSGDDDDVAAGGKEPALDRAMMNELLLVCSNLGMLRVQNEGEEPVLMRGEDCEEWIHDLQRAIRRDHAKYKLVAKQLGKWKILQKKLLPLLLNHQHDWSLVFSILKVLVMLTMKPTKESTNVAQQLKYLRAYKHAFLRHDIVPILMTILIDPLSRKGSARTAQDYLNMELVLTLIRNVLAIPNEDPRFVTSTTTYLSHLQEDFIQTLHEESAYEMILLFAQDIESAENREWNLLIMEMMDLTLDCSHPKAVAAFANQRLTGVINATTVATSGASGSRGASSAAAAAAKTVSLTKTLQSEKLSGQQQKLGGSRRHSNFGGVLTLVGPTGRSTLLTNFSKVADDQVPQAAKKPVTRRRGGRQRAGPAADISEIFSSSAKVTESDHATMSVLMEICDSLVAKSYFQLTNSLKNEFRRGSSKLVSTDRLQYFHLVWFLTTYHRLKLQAQKSHYRQQLRAHEKAKTQLLQNMDFATPAPPPPAKPELDEKAVLSTLDMFSFNFVLQSIETYASVKNIHGMTVSVQLLTEMMSYLTELHSSDDPRYQRIADSLQHKILYERDFLDRLPVLLRSWSPGTFSKDYVADVVTLTHLVFKMLDAQGNIKVLSRRKALLETKKKKTKKAKQDGDASESESDEEEEAERQAQLLLEMQRKEADFDVRRYFQSLLSPDTIKMYCFLLATYRDNSARVNHYIHSFFYRIKHFPIYPNEKEWTMQPLLYNIHVLLLFHRMLQDAAIQKQPEFKAFLDFIRGVVRDYFALAQRNHLLFVESLLRQPYAVKSALLLQRNYEPLDSMAKSKSEAIALGREKQIALINEVRRQKKAIDAEELEGEEEFQFTLAPSDFQASSLAKRASGDEDESAGEAEFDAAAVAAAASAPKTKAKKPRAATSKAGADRAKNWTKVEDRYLEKMYRMYRHLPSVYEVISYEDMFQDRDRTAEQIERRVKFLKLHRKTHDSSDEDEDAGASKSEDSDDEGDETMSSKRNDSDGDLDLELLARGSAAPLASTRPRRRLRRVSTRSDGDSDSEDDLLQQLVGGRKPIAHTSGGDASAAGSHSPDTAANGNGEEEEDAAGATQILDEDMAEDGADRTDAARDGEARVGEETDSEQATQALESGDAATQVTDDVADTQMLVDDEDSGSSGAIAAAATTEGDATEAVPATQVLEEDAMEATQDAVEDDEVAGVAPPAAAAGSDDAPLPSHKRSRDSVADDDSAQDADPGDAPSGSPQKKVARSGADE